MDRMRHVPWLAARIALATSLLFSNGALAATITDADFKRCLGGLRAPAAKAGVSNTTYDRYTPPLVADPTVLDALDAQPEFVTPVWDYLAALVDAERIADGKRLLREHAATLAQIADTYRVDPETVVAVWGVESDFGRVFGKRPLLVSLATLSCAGRRQDYFRSEFFAALKIVQAGDVRADEFVGSWAGAFGHTQFMPSTFLRIAVDHDGDGRRDLIANSADALASTANYLAISGWRRGEPWGFEIKLPGNFDTKLAGRKSKRPLVQWAQQGIVRIDGSALIGRDAPADRAAAVIVPAGKGGPAFVVFRNYDAIFSYNAAESYSLAIAFLAEAFRGRSLPVVAWPTDDPGLSRAERRELQTVLAARGHEIGEIDGLIGKATREAIQREQKALGLEVDGRAGRRLLTRLREAR
jgi:lytic murein transglycosylase